MGGFGSGKWTRCGAKTHVEHVRDIDIRRWARDGLLYPGMQWGWKWHSEGETLADIFVRVYEDALTLVYTVQVREGPKESVEEPVILERTPCNYGGERVWFRCPGVVDGVRCNRRVAILYGAAKYFLCRHCYRLTYESQSEDELDRVRRQARKVRRKLGGDGRLDTFFFPRPKGMHQTTYQRLQRECYDLDIKEARAFHHMVMRWFPGKDQISE